MNFEVGSVVYSKAGRDKDNCYVVVSCLQDNYYQVVDGEARTLAKPKRKNARHLKSKGVKLDAIAEKLKSGKVVYDNEIRSALRAYKEQ